ncbi:MAG: DUF4296 domain-containing protein [Bacteroidaceae bacterium]|nr:DUF4296 domain-containing protein [Bacteroidaceae bacterium]
MINRRYLFLLVLQPLLLLGCKPSLPDDVMSERKMERVLYDFHIAQGMTEHVPRSEGQDYESMRYELQQAVFRKHGITQEEFDRSMTYYLSDMDKMNSIYKNVSERLERDAEALGVAAGPRDVYASLTADGDTANVWADRLFFAVRNSRLSNFQLWSIPCDSTWQAGDDLLWRFELKQISNAYGPGEFFVDLVVTYTNDSVSSQLQNVANREDVELRINNPANWTPRTVSGHLYTPILNDPKQSRIYFLHSPALIRFHKPQVPDAAPADSLQNDSVEQASEAVDTTESQRLTPEQLRDRQPVDRTIDVVKQKPYQAPRRGSTKKRFAQPRRMK